MSIPAVNWAFSLTLKDSTAKFVLVAMCDWANEAWEAYPSIAGLCEKTDMNRKTVLAAIDRLKSLGLIEDTGERKGATRQIIVYHINHETVPKTELSQKRNSTEFTRKQSQKRDTEPSLNHQSKKESARGVRADDGFDSFWTTYPKKVGKAAALKSWQKIKPADELQATIMAAIASQRDSANWKRDGGQYIPNPATWLNQGRWDDVVETAAPSWTEDQAAFIAIVADELDGLVLPPAEWTADRANAIDVMFGRLGNDAARAREALRRTAKRVDPRKMGQRTFDWWALSSNRDRIRAGHFDKEAR